MKKSTISRLIKYGAAAFICGGVAYLYIFLRDFESLSRRDQYRMLSDAFLIPGMITALLGCLIAISNEGALNGIAYVAVRAVRMLIPGIHNKEEKYYDYIERRRENPVKGYGFLFVVGGVFIAVSLVFLILFYH